MGARRHWLLERFLQGCDLVSRSKDGCLRSLRHLHGAMTSGTAEILYPRSPILEAVIELRYSDVSAQKVMKAGSSLQSRYDARLDELLVEGNLDFGAKTSTFRDVTPKVSLSTSDQTNAFNVTATNAVWARLAPYEGWQPFIDRVKEEMPKILKALGNPKLTRIGLRYVNRIDVPIRDNLGHHEEYLSYRIDAGSFLEPHDGYKWTLQKEFPDRNMGAVVRSSTARGEIPDVGAVMFDIDISVLVDVPSKSDEILKRLCDMRQLKNEIFEAGITDKARELFNEPRS